MESFKMFVSKLCEPISQEYSTPNAKQSQWKRNTTNFYAFLIVNVFFIAFFPLSYSSKLYLINVFLNFSAFFLFILLCRSYLWVFHLLHTLMVCFAAFPILEVVDEACYYYLGYAFALPPFLMMFHGNLKLAGLAGSMQLVVMQTTWKKALARTIAFSTPLEFSTAFVDATTVHFVVTLVVLLYFLKLLNQRTVELEKAKKATEEALEQQRTFIFSFSHELRNPLNSLLGNLQLVLMGGNSASVTREMVNTAKVCGEILLQAINNVLDTGKHDMGKLEIHPVPTRIFQLFQRSWVIYQEILRQKKLKSSLKIEKKIFAMLKVDATKINQIISNLLGNAIKFTEKGSINLTIKWLLNDRVDDSCFEPRPYDETDEGIFEKNENFSFINEQYSESYEGKKTFSADELRYPQDNEVKGVLKIIVQDTGSGMNKEQLEKLFKKFSQVSDDASRRQIGTGLGLFITKEICKAMGGDIRVYSKPAVGTTFVVCIPAVAPPSNPRRKNMEGMLNSLRERRIQAIVADDSTFNVKLACDYLGELGADIVSVAYNGEDAYMKYRESQSSGQKLDLIVLDINMPKMNGKQVCELIRKYEQLHNKRPVTIIFISGNYDKEQMNEYLDKSKGRRADYFLKKPVYLEEFATAIYSLVTH